MQDFAQLLDRLTLTPARNGKLRLMEDFFRRTPDPDRGWALAAITGELDLVSVKPAMLRSLVAERMDAELFAMSHDYVGDLAEAVSLVWDNELRTAASGAAGGAERREKPRRNYLPSLSEVVETLTGMTKVEALKQVEDWLDLLDASARYALLKLVTGGLRIGVSARLAKQALANLPPEDRGGPIDIAEVEELWHGLDAPYEPLFAWLLDGAPKPEHAAAAPFRPVMLSTAVEEPDLERYEPADYAAEWKWDGIRVQATQESGTKRLYSRTGDDIGNAFPDLMAAMDFEGTVDGELLVRQPGRDHDRADDGSGSIDVGTFSDLQQRLNRKTVSRKVQEQYPVFVRVYDLLFDGDDDLRSLPFRERRARLEAFMPRLDPARFDLSPLLPFERWDEVVAHRAEPPHPIIEGLMLKRWDAPYVPGRPRGPWFKWKRDPFAIDAVMMYAQRGHGRRSSFYSDYTFGVWKDVGGHDELVPVGKAYFGFTDEELKRLDKFVRLNTTERFGPVRGVTANKEKGLVLEVAFEGIQKSTRHKSGVAMRFPRVSRLRWDKPPAEADRIEALEALIEAQERMAESGGEEGFRQVARKG